MDSACRSLVFDCSLKSPGTWLLCAKWLKRAAEEIDCFDHAIGAESFDLYLQSPEGDFLFMHPVFKMLMGLSFENLLKGMIVANRGAAGASGKIDKDITTHKIGNLIPLLNRSQVPLSREEEDLLTGLEGYVVWAGRYPFPKSPNELFQMANTSSERELMLRLWDRLFDTLRRMGWITKGDGSKLWTDSSRNPPVPHTP